MCRYTVFDHSEAAREGALLDAYGKLHVVRWPAARPTVGEVMHGPRAVLGFHMLSAEVSRRAYGTDFLLIDCAHTALLLRWAVQPPAALVAPRGGGHRPAPAGTAVARRRVHRAKLVRRRRAQKPAATLPAPGV
jgi:hypothetical protein